MRDGEEVQMNSLGEVVNHAMELVEKQSDQLTCVLPKDYTIFSDELLAELLVVASRNCPRKCPERETVEYLFILILIIPGYRIPRKAALP